MARKSSAAPVRKARSKTASAGKNDSEPSAQALKSARTRARLTDATISCLVKYGYANTTTPKVAEQAGLSRGAMLHHFENASQLMQATLIELHNRQLRAFRRAVDTIDHDARTLLRSYWQQLQRPNFIAFHELAIASRTDKQLAETLEPVRIEFRQRWHEQAIELFPEWANDLEAFEVALAITQNTLEGMAVNLLTQGIDDATTERVLNHLERVILDLRPDKDSAAPAANSDPTPSLDAA